MRTSTKIQLLTSFSLVISLIFFDTVNAIYISPLRQAITIEPGYTEKVGIEIGNNTNKSITVNGGSELFELDSETGLRVNVKNSKESLWISPLENEAQLEAGATTTVWFLVDIPVDTTPQTYYFILYANSSSNDKNTLNITNRVGSLLYLHVAGEGREEIIAKNFFVKDFIFGSSVPIEIDLYNNGTIHAIPEGVISIYNLNTRINTTQTMILPGGTYKREINIPIPWWWFGPMEIRADINYGLSNQRIILIEKTFIISKKISLITSLILASVVSFWLFLRWRFKQTIKVKNNI